VRHLEEDDDEPAYTTKIRARPRALGRTPRSTVHPKPGNWTLLSKTFLHRRRSRLSNRIGKVPMAIDFRLTSHQRALQLESRIQAVALFAGQVIPIPDPALGRGTVIDTVSAAKSTPGALLCLSRS
jgi:hypothetical protein